jgi:hypothetical protein
MISKTHPAQFAEIRSLISTSAKEVDRLDKFLTWLSEKCHEMSAGEFQKAQDVRDLLDDGAKLAIALLEFSAKVDNIGAETKNRYAKNAALFSWIAREGLPPPPDFDAVSRRLLEAAMELEMLKVYLAGTYSLSAEFLGAVKPPRAKKTFGLVGAVLFLVMAWEVMTQTPMQYPNQFCKGGLLGERPKYGDAYFVLLMLNICAGVGERTVAETAIKGALAVKKRAAREGDPWAGALESSDAELRSKWEALRA